MKLLPLMRHFVRMFLLREAQLKPKNEVAATSPHAPLQPEAGTNSFLKERNALIKSRSSFAEMQMGQLCDTLFEMSIILHFRLKMNTDGFAHLTLQHGRVARHHILVVDLHFVLLINN